MQNWKGMFCGLSFLSLHFKLFIFCIVQTGHMWKSADNFGSWFSLPMDVDPSNQTQSLRPNCKYLCPWAIWLDPLIWFYDTNISIAMVDEEKTLSDLDHGICRPRQYPLLILKGNLKFSQCPSKILNQKKNGFLY